MTHTLKTLSKLSAVALAVGLFAGCASTADEGMSSDAQAAQAAATNAQATADQALQTANEALACCRANEEKFDRMFRQSMMK